MATPADTSPLVTVEKLNINQTQGVLSLEAAREGIKGFNATCQKQPMPFDELVNVMLIAQGFGATSLTAIFNIGSVANDKQTWTLNVETASASQPDPTTQTPPLQLTARQQAYAEHVLTDVVGDLAKRGHEGKDLNKRALSLATALQAGLSQLTPTSCSTRPASYEQR